MSKILVDEQLLKDAMVILNAESVTVADLDSFTVARRIHYVLHGKLQRVEIRQDLT